MNDHWANYCALVQVLPSVSGNSVSRCARSSPKSPSGSTLFSPVLVAALATGCKELRTVN